MEERLVRYEKIRRDLEQKIRLGEYASGEQLPSEKELTVLYSVSRITISKAISLLRDGGFVYRVQGKGTFVSPPETWLEALPRTGLSKPGEHTAAIRAGLPDNPASQGEAPRKIGVVIPQLVDFHGLEIIHGITDQLCPPENLVLTVSSRNQQFEDYSLRWFQEQGFAGLIIFPVDSELYNEAILSMQLARYPFVLIDRYFPGINSSFVTADNRLGAGQAVEYLFSLGHERIAFCASSPMSEQATASRFEGYSTALNRRGLLPQTCRNPASSPADREWLLHAAVRREITAAICSNTFTALEVLKLCQEGGLRVPEDFSVVCFDSATLLPEENSYFTHIDQQSYQMGAKAAKILQTLLARPKDCANPVQLVLKPRLVPGRSSGSVPLPGTSAKE